MPLCQFESEVHIYSRSFVLLLFYFTFPVHHRHILAVRDDATRFDSRNSLARFKGSVLWHCSVHCIFEGISAFTIYRALTHAACRRQRTRAARLPATFFRTNEIYYIVSDALSCLLRLECHQFDGLGWNIYVASASSSAFACLGNSRSRARRDLETISGVRLRNY